jgi:hypothetical protein
LRHRLSSPSHEDPDLVFESAELGIAGGQGRAAVQRQGRGEAVTETAYETA